jgi:hypothetical protein
MVGARATVSPTAATKGGLASKLPSEGQKSKNDPRDPKHPSVSGNAEQ